MTSQEMARKNVKIKKEIDIKIDQEINYIEKKIQHICMSLF